jgi:NitT/TauT family transport system permease protein
MKPSGRIVSRLVLLIVIFVPWQFAPPSLQFWLGKPSVIAVRLWGWAVDGSLWGHLEATLLAMASGYLLGCASGIVVGLAFGLFPRAYRIVSPYVWAVYSLPKIALAPLFVIVFGTGIESKIALVAITVFFLVLNATQDGVKNVDRDAAQSLRIMGATSFEMIWKFTIPSALPWIMTGMRIAVRYAFVNTLLAELIAANQGVGYLVELYSGRFDANGAYAAVLLLVILSVMLTELLSWIEGRFVRAK